MMGLLNFLWWKLFGFDALDDNQMVLERGYGVRYLECRDRLSNTDQINEVVDIFDKKKYVSKDNIKKYCSVLNSTYNKGQSVCELMLCVSVEHLQTYFSGNLIRIVLMSVTGEVFKYDFYDKTDLYSDYFSWYSYLRSCAKEGMICGVARREEDGRLDCLVVLEMP